MYRTQGPRRLIWGTWDSIVSSWCALGWVCVRNCGLISSMARAVSVQYLYWPWNPLSPLLVVIGGSFLGGGGG
jgi:uncharacterized membrane protein